MQRYMLRILVILAVVGVFNAPLDLIRRFRRGPHPAGPVVSGPQGPAPVWQGQDESASVPRRPAA